MEWLNLLSPKDFASFTPEEFRAYIRTLYFKKVKKTPTIRLKKTKPPFVVTKTAKGNLSVIVNRDPKFITSGELDHIIAEAFLLGFPEDQTKKKLKKIEIRQD
jgi:hypothetical protein